MLSSITPLGERARDQRWWLTATAYTAASAIGGALVGALIAATLGVALRGVFDAFADEPARHWVVAGLVVSAAGAEWRGLRIPGPRRQVNEDWLTRYRGWVYGGAYGVQLGFGIVTKVSTSALYLALGLAAVAGSILGGVVIGFAFGVARAVPLLLVRRIERPDQLRALHHRIAASASSVRSGAALALASLGVALSVAAVTGG